MHPPDESLKREKLLVEWLSKIKDSVESLYLMGDIFDFWYEYKKVAPRGFTRFLGKISEYHDDGIPVHFFTGNHDVWVYDYLPQETGIIVHRKPFTTEIGGKKFYLAHGDGLGPGDKAYHILKWAFTNKTLQWLFSRLHPNFAFWLGHSWSNKSRISKGVYADFKGKEKEWLILHSYKILEQEHYDYFIFGHRHIPVHILLKTNSEYICLGDWIVHYTYAVYDGSSVQLRSLFPEKETSIIC